MFLRAVVTTIWITVGWIRAEGDRQLEAFVFWGWMLFLTRWLLIGEFPAKRARVQILPIRSADLFQSLWRSEVTASCLFAFETEWVLGSWLRAHGYGEWGWLVALPLAAMASATSLALAAAAVSRLSPRVVGVFWLGTVALGLVLILARNIAHDWCLGVLRLVYEVLSWVSPIGWAIQAAQSLSPFSWWSLAFAAASLAVLSTLPQSREKIIQLIEDHALGTLPQSEEELIEELSSEPSPVVTWLDAEAESEISTRIKEHLTVTKPIAMPLAGDAITGGICRFSPRFAFLFGILRGHQQHGSKPLIKAIRFALVALAAIWLMRSYAPAFSPHALAISTIAFAIADLPVLGGSWPGLIATGSALRHVPQLALWPLSKWELAKVVLVGNMARLLSFGAIGIPFFGAGSSMIGMNTRESFLQSGIVFLFLFAAQPIAVAIRFLARARFYGFVNFSLMMLTVLFGGATLLLTLGCIGAPGPVGTMVLFSLAGWLLTYFLSGLLMWRLVRGKMDLVT